MGSRIRFTKAIQVFETYPDLADDVSEPSAELGPADYIFELRDGEEPLKALAYFAHVLPKREAVWWGLKCVAGLDITKDKKDNEILSLTENWVRDGDEEARLAVQDAAQASKTESASTWIGLAAGWSGGSLSPNPEYRVDAPDDLTAKAVNTAVLIAIGALEPSERQVALKSCLSAGLSFADGGSMPVVSVKRQEQASS